MADLPNPRGFVRSFIEFGPGFKDKIEKAVDARKTRAGTASASG
jgi:hypothetical protein